MIVEWFSLMYLCFSFISRMSVFLSLCYRALKLWTMLFRVTLIFCNKAKGKTEGIGGGGQWRFVSSCCQEPQMFYFLVSVLSSSLHHQTNRDLYYFCSMPWNLWITCLPGWHVVMTMHQWRTWTPFFLRPEWT